MFQALNPLTIPIADTNLIEASAGTGKTWSIAALFTRLVLLEQYRVDKILVVTFTKAATAELKNRLRARLDEALRALNVDDSENPELLRQNCVDAHGQFDAFLFDLLQKALEKENLARLRLRLKAAIGEFDNAAIYTIHGFCQRVLQDFAFLCHVPFDIKLEEESAYHQQLTAAQDFWRTRVAHDAVLAELTYRHGITPQSQLNEVRQFLARPYLVFRQPEQPSLPYSVLVANFQAAWANIQQNLHEIEAAFWAIRPVLNGNNYRVNTFTKKFTALKKLPEKPNLLKLKEILHSSNKVDLPFSLAFMQEKNTGKGTLDMQKALIVSQLNDLVAHIDDILLAEQAILQTLSHDFMTHLRQQRQELKKHSPQRVFDDLLLDVYTALLDNPEHAQTLSAALAQNWQVALIDEFQDTDPLQYAIFRTAFAQNQIPLFLVGDPKQAIYHFRGADIFAYLDAVQHSQHHYTLDTNRRSHSRLMNSIGAWFARQQPFVLPNIHYQPVKTSRSLPDITFRQPEHAHALNVHWLPNPNKDNREILSQRAASLCANQIAHLLNQGDAVRIKDTPLHAGQIAVLVHARKDGALVQRELKKRRIQSVLLSTHTVFAEAEAEAVAALLAWVIQPQQTGLLRFVLASCLFEYDAEQLHELNQQESQLLSWIDSAYQTSEQWQKHGIYAALQQFMAQHQVETRLLAQQNERTLTNLHQIMELLAQEDELSHTPSSLLQWLNAQIQAAKEDPNGAGNHVLRLESDENLVKIVTMHASKGLEYPIVFCPFVWQARQANSKTEWYIAHENQQAHLVHKSQYKADAALKQSIDDEKLSENLRLLYVAMTRAREQLHLYLTHYSESKNAAISYLLQADEAACKTPEDYYACLRHFVENQDPEHTDFVFLSDETASQEDVVWLAPQPTMTFQAASFPVRRFHFVQHASFTSLSRQSERAAAELLPVLDFDEQEMAATQNDEMGEGILGFPKGAAAGVCLHAIFENLAFNESVYVQSETVANLLTQHGFDANVWCETIVAMCESARQTPLLPRANLANVPYVLSEMNFLLKAQGFKLHDIQNFMANPRFRLPENVVQAAQHLQFRDVYGFLNGAIDLVAQTQQGDVLIVDYKSNYLGNHADAYQPHALNEAIAEHHYYLQALIYAIATARYLQSRHALPKMLHIRYLFLRGLDGISENGVWAWDIATEDLSIWLNN